MTPKLPPGKIPPNILKKYVFNRLGVFNERVIQGPNIGEDAAIIDIGEKVLVVASDPITGAENNIGWLSVHINANDVASCGARPIWFLAVVLLPEGGGGEILDTIMDDMNNALREINVSLIGGHTEITPGLKRPIISGFIIGEAEKNQFITTGGAKPDDLIILTKGAGIEGTGILAQDLHKTLRSKIGEKVLEDGKKMLGRISVVPEAMKALEVGGVDSLHDPTEGGVINGLWEMAEAANVGLIINEKKIPISYETREICQALDIDPLKLLGSGALLIGVKPETAHRMIKELTAMGIKSSIIGKVTYLEEGRVLIKKDGRIIPITAVEQDELYRIIDQT
jgi:hydrogenase maturation factor